MVDKGGGPMALLTAVADIDVFGTGITEVVCIKVAIGCEFLGITDADGVASLAARSHADPAGHVLTEIHDMAGGGVRMTADGQGGDANGL